MTMLVAILLAPVSCSAQPADSTPLAVPSVVATRPHDPSAFTEGLELDGDTLYEGTGMPGRSWVRATEWTTGATVATATLPAPLFGEGVTRVGDTLWEMTWRDHVAVERDARTLVERRRVTLDDEGWGLCHRTRSGRTELLASDGADTVVHRDPTTFARIRTVRLIGRPDAQLNSLACASDGTVYADLWPTDRLIRFDPDTGRVLEEIDASALRPVPFDPQAGNVLNGITQIPGTDEFLLTGKLWPTSFIVRFAKERSGRA
jgi:glutamine cyclotransferase